MQVRQIISLDRGDLANPRQIEDVFGLIGGFDLPEEQQKIFRRFEANAFSIDDIRVIGEIIAEAERRPIPKAFADERLQSIFAGGIQTNLVVARRKYEAFVEDVKSEMPR